MKSMQWRTILKVRYESIVPQTLQDAMMDFILTGLQRHISTTEEKR